MYSKSTDITIYIRIYYSWHDNQNIDAKAGGVEITLPVITGIPYSTIPIL